MGGFIRPDTGWTQGLLNCLAQIWLTLINSISWWVTEKCNPGGKSDTWAQDNVTWAKKSPSTGNPLPESQTLSKWSSSHSSFSPLTIHPSISSLFFFLPSISWECKMYHWLTFFHSCLFYAKPMCYINVMLVCRWPWERVAQFLLSFYMVYSPHYYSFLLIMISLSKSIIMFCRVLNVLPLFQYLPSLPRILHSSVSFSQSVSLSPSPPFSLSLSLSLSLSVCLSLCLFVCLPPLSLSLSLSVCLSVSLFYLLLPPLPSPYFSLSHFLSLPIPLFSFPKHLQSLFPLSTILSILHPPPLPSHQLDNGCLRRMALHPETKPSISWYHRE